MKGFLGAGFDAGSGAAERRADLDWIRVAAFGVLILYHIGLFFSPWDWHVNSRHPLPWVGVALVFSNPWRLTLLFLVSGAALRFMSRRMAPGQLAISRSKRLLIPLAFGLLVLVPPQAYVEDTMKAGLVQSYLEYWGRFFLIDRGLCLSGSCKPVPLNHLWFVLYIWAYALAMAALMALPVAWERLGERLRRTLVGGWVLVLPAAYLVLVRVLLLPHFPITNQLPGDWYNHAASFAAFAFGFWMAGETAIWRTLDRLRWDALGLAASTALPLAIEAAWQEINPGPQSVAMMAVHAINQWCVIAAILGFAYRLLRQADGPALAYLRQGIFPFYLVHQTIIVLAVYAIDRIELPNAGEAAVLIAVTAGGCLLIYELVKRAGPFRGVFGLPALKPAVSRS